MANGSDSDLNNALHMAPLDRYSADDGSNGTNRPRGCVAAWGYNRAADYESALAAPEAGLLQFSAARVPGARDGSLAVPVPLQFANPPTAPWVGGVDPLRPVQLDERGF